MLDVLGTITLKIDPARPTSGLLRRLRAIAQSSAALVYTTILDIIYCPSTFTPYSRWDLPAKYRVRSYVEEFWKLLPRALATLTQLRTIRYVQYQSNVIVLIVQKFCSWSSNWSSWLRLRQIWVQAPEIDAMLPPPESLDDIEQALLSCQALENVLLDFDIIYPGPAPPIHQLTNLRQLDLRVNAAWDISDTDYGFRHALSTCMARNLGVETLSVHVEYHEKFFSIPSGFTLRDILQGCPRDTPLTLKHLSLTNVPFHLDFQTLPHLKSLRTLSITMVWPDMHTTTTSLHGLLGTGIELETLSLNAGFGKPGDPIIMDFGGTLRYLSSYTGLTSLSWIGIEDEHALDRLFETVIPAHASTLRELHMCTRSKSNLSIPWTTHRLMTTAHLAVVATCHKLVHWTVPFCLEQSPGHEGTILVRFL